jgi:hypothetical protein
MTVFPTGYFQSIEGRELINLIVRKIGIERISNRIPEQEIMITLFVLNHFSIAEMFAMIISLFSDLISCGFAAQLWIRPQRLLPFWAAPNQGGGPSFFPKEHGHVLMTRC